MPHDIQCESGILLPESVISCRGAYDSFSGYCNKFKCTNYGRVCTLKVMAGDIMNVYIPALNKQKIWMLLGPKFGKDKGLKAIVVRALYGSKSVAWHSEVT